LWSHMTYMLYVAKKLRFERPIRRVLFDVTDQFLGREYFSALFTFSRPENHSIVPIRLDHARFIAVTIGAFHRATLSEWGSWF
jgi:hypothetical protein